MRRLFIVIVLASCGTAVPVESTDETAYHSELFDPDPWAVSSTEQTKTSPAPLWPSPAASFRLPPVADVVVEPTQPGIIHGIHSGAIIALAITEDGLVAA